MVVLLITLHSLTDFDFEAGTEGAARARGITKETGDSIRAWLQENQ